MTPDPAVLVVTGSSLEAEERDRPGAYALRDLIAAGLKRRAAPGTVVVCSDLWYLNQERLRSRPTISVGPPEANALTAFLGDKLPSVYAVDESLVVLADPEFIDLVACCWGRGPDGTRLAIGALVERFLEGFLDAVARAG